MAYPNGFFAVIVNANLLPAEGETPDILAIDGCSWNDPNTKVNPAVIGGVQYSAICLSDYDSLDNFLAINNLGLNPEANYMYELPPRP